MFIPESSFLNFITSYGYFGLYAIVAIETFEFFFSIPLGPILAFLGGLARQGDFHPFLLWLIAWLGAMTGDLAGYFLGLKAGRPILHKLSRRWLKPEKLDKAEMYFSKKGVWAVFFGRFILASIAAVINVLAGISKMPFWKFWLAESIGQAIWAASYILLGYYFGSQFMDLIHNLSVIWSFWIAPLLILALVLIVYLIVLRKRRKTRNP
ncbi:MAG: DedA family protein [Patescibacteria group bacterium]|jgi:membrane protein DedA with SNARE-associated domain